MNKVKITVLEKVSSKAAVKNLKSMFDEMAKNILKIYNKHYSEMYDYYAVDRFKEKNTSDEEEEEKEEEKDKMDEKEEENEEEENKDKEDKNNEDYKGNETKVRKKRGRRRKKADEPKNKKCAYAQKKV